MDISVTERESRLLAVFEKLRKRVPAPKVQSWIHSTRDPEEKLFALFLRELCGDSSSGRKLYDAFGPWMRTKSLVESNDTSTVDKIWKGIGYLRFKGHRKIFHRKYIVGEPPREKFHDSSLHDYCTLVSNFASQANFYQRDFKSVFSDLMSIRGGDRTFAFDLIESVYREVIFHSALLPRGLCLEGSTGPSKGFNLLFFGRRELRRRDLQQHTSQLWGAKKEVWDIIEVQGERLIQQAAEKARQKGESTEFIAFEFEDFICNYQKELKLGNLPERFLNGEVSVDSFAKAYLRVFGKRRSMSRNDLDPMSSHRGA